MNSWCSFFFKLLVLQTAISENIRDNGNDTLNEFSSENEELRALSRRKRYVIFPDGSSLQLVFCNQVTAIIPIGDIFLFGYTVALAWNLPTNPKDTLFKKLEEKPLRRNDQMTDNINNYSEKNGRMSERMNSKRRIHDPAFAKRSIDTKPLPFKDKLIELRKKIDREKMHARHINRDYLKAGHLNTDIVDFHRSNRIELYKKLEVFINGLGPDGRQCVLYKLCQAAQRRPGQGTFIQEFLTLVFTLPKGDEFTQDTYKEYDQAHNASEDCLERYPNCIENYNM